MIKITHLTSAHPRYDARIFVKECCSLAMVENYAVSLIVADNLGDEKKNNVQIYDVGKLEGRFNRISKTTQKVFDKAKELDSDIYHFHDPELIPTGVKLKKLGKKVIFDIHEDVPKQINSKPYMNPFFRKIVSKLYGLYEKFQCKKFDCLVVPTPIIEENFEVIHTDIIQIRNYPILDELLNITPWQKRKNEVCHIGSLAKARGIKELVKSLKKAKTPLALCGDFRPKSLEYELRELEGWKYVNFHGFISRSEVKEVLSCVKIGIVTLHPTQSYLEAIPVKLFEYMAAGIPVIASDFKFYRELLKGCDCALFVDPLNPDAIANAITELLEDEKKAYEMGRQGQKAIIERFNWSTEEKKLLQMYNRLVK